MEVNSGQVVALVEVSVDDRDGSRRGSKSDWL